LSVDDAGLPWEIRRFSFAFGFLGQMPGAKWRDKNKISRGGLGNNVCGTRVLPCERGKQIRGSDEFTTRRDQWITMES
jgi:hypothetical protein